MLETLNNYQCYYGLRGLKPCFRYSELQKRIEKLKRERAERRKEYVILEQRYFIQQNAIDGALKVEEQAREEGNRSTVWELTKIKEILSEVIK